MSTDEESMRRQIESITVNGQPDRDAVQRQLTEQFIADLLARGDDTPDQICERFAEQHDGQLQWLGEARQDEILRAGMRETGVDLSHWLASGEEDEHPNA